MAAPDSLVIPRLGSNKIFNVLAQPGLLPDSSSSTNQNGQQQPTQEVMLVYTDLRTIGNGSFGVVFQASLQRPTQEQVAIKKVLQDKRFKNRELQIMRKLDHCNVVKLKYFFHTSGDTRGGDVYLHLVLEYMPDTLYRIARNHSRTRESIPMLHVKLYMYQLFRSLNYIHSMDICHRDIKPQNLLLNPETGVLKLCDFGSAKSLVGGEPNVAYICSRYYRAPELIFGATDYTTKIDIWSAGCVMAELILGEPMFPGESGVDQLVEIIKILGTPTREQMRAMNPNYTEFRFPVIRARSWNRIFSSHIRTPPETARLVSNLLEYTPSRRLSPLGACAHPFFDELRSSSTNSLPNGREFPPLFNFSDQELRKEPELAARLMPELLTQQQRNMNANSTTSSSRSASCSSITCGVTSPSATRTLDPEASSNPNSSNSNTATTTSNNNSNDDSSSSGVSGPSVPYVPSSSANATTGSTSATTAPAPTASQIDDSNEPNLTKQQHSN